MTSGALHSATPLPPRCPGTCQNALSCATCLNSKLRLSCAADGMVHKMSRMSIYLFVQGQAICEPGIGIDFQGQEANEGLVDLATSARF